MRILALVTDAFGGQGGIAKFNRDLLSALCGVTGVEKVVALPRLAPDAPGKLPEKLEFVMDGVGGKVRFALAVLKTAFRNRQSGMIICGHVNLLPLAVMARWFCGAPVVLVVHGIDAWQPTRSGLVNRLIRKLDVFVSVSDFTRQRFLAWTGTTQARSFILPNCVDLKQFTPGGKSDALLERYGLRNRVVLLTLARLSAQERYKGIDEIMEVLPALAEKVPNLSYLVVGDGTDRERLQQKAAALGLGDRVVFAGRVTDEEIPAHHRLADVYVMPGWGEGFGIVYLEAMACGIPVVASTEDASAEVVAGCEAAVAVNPRDPASIQAGVLRMLELQKTRGPARPARVEFYSKERFQQRVGEMVAELNPAD